jgi:ABC-type microcin C transport system duplicated ATPase subunit YejF
MGKLKSELGMSILFITHDLGLVREFSDTVSVMKDGKIVEQGNTQQIFDHPQNDYTKKLLDSEPLPKTDLLLETSSMVKVENLDIFYDIPSINFLKKNRFHAVKDISFDIQKNTTIGLVGESGSGKSTLGRAIANLLKYEGKILYQGKDLQSYNRKEMQKLKKDIQIVFQDPYGSLSPRMTIGEIIGEGLDVHFDLTKDQKNKRIDEAMVDVGIDPNMKFKYPHEFSGGQRQRIAIARSVILQPAFMILDEPTSALDRSIQIQIIDLLKNIQDKYELTYLFISHDLKVIRSVSDYIFVMQDGNLVESGKANEVFDNPKEDYTNKLLTAALKYATN